MSRVLAHSGPRFSPPGPFGRTNGEVWHRSDEGLRVKLLVPPRLLGACGGGVVTVVGGMRWGASWGASTQGCWQSGRPLA